MKAKAKVHHKHVWRRLTALAKRTRGVVAVAYLGQGGAAQLSLRKGSTLVVNLSMQTVKAGITDPREILKLLTSGVKVHTVENLHAKVYVFGKTALIGSPNVSRYSANHLVEAALETSDPGQVAACRAFVLHQIGDEVTKERAKRFVPYWRPPKHQAASIPKRMGVVEPHHRRTWIVHIWNMDYDKDDERNAKKGRPIARKRRAACPALPIGAAEASDYISRCPQEPGVGIALCCAQAARRRSLSHIARRGLQPARGQRPNRPRDPQRDREGTR